MVPVFCDVLIFGALSGDVITYGAHLLWCSHLWSPLLWCHHLWCPSLMMSSFMESSPMMSSPMVPISSDVLTNDALYCDIHIWWCPSWLSLLCCCSFMVIPFLDGAVLYSIKGVKITLCRSSRLPNNESNHMNRYIWELKATGSFHELFIRFVEEESEVESWRQRVGWRPEQEKTFANEYVKYVSNQIQYSLFETGNSCIGWTFLKEML